jgi:hypothetical protein
MLYDEATCAPLCRSLVVGRPTFAYFWLVVESLLKKSPAPISGLQAKNAGWFSRKPE